MGEAKELMSHEVDETGGVRRGNQGGFKKADYYSYEKDKLLKEVKETNE